MLNLPELMRAERTGSPRAPAACVVSGGVKMEREKGKGRMTGKWGGERRTYADDGHVFDGCHFDDRRVRSRFNVLNLGLSSKTETIIIQ